MIRVFASGVISVTRPERPAGAIDGRMHAASPALKGIRSRLLRRARRHVSCTAAAEDLVQEALLAAHRAGRDWFDPGTERWMNGVLWRQAAFVRRTESRRTAREHAVACADTTIPAPSRAPLPPLPQSLRAVARLAAAGCTRDEIAWLLGLTSTALRQRISSARRRLGGAPPPPLPAPAVASGPIRQSVLPLSRRTGRLGTHDPDGHPMLLGRSQNPPLRQPRG